MDYEMWVKFTQGNVIFETLLLTRLRQLSLDNIIYIRQILTHFNVSRPDVIIRSY